MQSLRWYRSRLDAMSFGEMRWRVASTARHAVDRCVLGLRSFARSAPTIRGQRNADRVWSDAEVVLPAHAIGADDLPVSLSDSRSQLMTRAEQGLLNRHTLFGRYACELGPSVQWNSDYSTGRTTSLQFAADIDYRNYDEVGDAKVVWELNRHQHLTILGRAYRLTGDRRYAERVVQHMRSWADQCPFGRGMNWRSPLELAIRLINWVCALELIAPSGLPSPQDARLIGLVAWRHLWEIARNYSRYSSANNHLVGEAVGVFIGSSFFSGLRQAARWRSKSHEILCREILLQTHADGGHRELATGYHLFVLEFFLLAALAGQRTGMAFPPAYWKRLEKMFDFLAALLEGGDALPMFGDSDDGYVLDLGRPEDRARELLSVGAVLFEREDYKSVAGCFSEPAFWLLGPDASDRFERVRGTSSQARIASRAFPQSGYYLLQHGRRNNADRVSVTFDCGELGFGSIAAHGHADALSFTLRAFGADVFVDPGTYDYFTDLPWRDHLRSTRAHNTVVIDGQDQSEMLGSFLWGRRAVATCRGWEVDERRTVAVGEVHSPVQSLSELAHRRSLTLDHQSGDLLVHDELSGSGEHTADAYFHLAEHCSVEPLADRRYRIDCGRGTLILSVDPRFTVTLHSGCLKTRLGWVSRGYHHRTAACTLRASCRWQDSLVTTSRITMGDATHSEGFRSEGLKREGTARREMSAGARDREMKEACFGTE